LVLIGQHEGFGPFPVTEILKALAVGLRFDLKILAILAILGLLAQGLWMSFELFLGFSRRQKLLERMRAMNLLGALLVAAIVLLIFASICQHFYYQFYKSSFSPLVFGLWEDDTQALLQTIYKDYPVLSLFILVAALGIALGLTQRYLASIFMMALGRLGLLDWRFSIVMNLALVLALLVAARGGLGTFPLVVDDSIATRFSPLNESVKNAPYALFSAWNERRDQIDYRPESEDRTLGRHGFSSKADLATALGRALDPKDANSLVLETVPKGAATGVSHVVFALMESWGAQLFDLHGDGNELLGSFGLHRSQDYFSARFLSAQSGTHAALEALLVNSPISPLTSGDLGGVAFQGAAAKPFRDAGFNTVFIYGGSAAWRSIGRAMRAQYFDQVFDMADIQARYPAARQTTWGIDDEHLFAFALEAIRANERAGKKSMVFLLTTTHHPPHSIPPHFVPGARDWSKIANRAQVTKDEGLAMLSTFQYSNHHLGEFLSQIKGSELAAKTLVAATGDHSFRVFFKSSLPQDALKLYAVPAYFYLPEIMRRNVAWQSGFAGHRDLFPTLYHLALPGTQFPSFGRSLFAARPIEEQFGMINNRLIFSEAGMVDLKGEKSLRYVWSATGDLATSESPKASSGEHMDAQVLRARAILAAQEWYLRQQLNRPEIHTGTAKR
jgi:phosphoglycerol transferase MdoB-like AlkP superfamily enzyme